MSAIASRPGPTAAIAAVAALAWRALTIVLHGLEVETDQVRQEEVVLGKVPGAVTDLHGIGLVGGGAGRRHVVQRRHGGGPPDRPGGVAKRPEGVRTVTMYGRDQFETTWKERAIRERSGGSKVLCSARLEISQIRLEWKEVGSDRQGMEKHSGQGMASRHRKAESWHGRVSRSDGIRLGGWWLWWWSARQLISS